ncbi:MAG: RNB domain-containing ribonuclease [Sphingomonadaceae bacterium]|uniref:ribonuclease R family protein n=1 Tax=Thermaurantiacus sp. TaxID=2820283 RepID=UPI00298EF8EC|nr:RNB domain-containing ribonuclease [Thermaurantiacus sp.]MCS6986363.1 RNB domain-containing ribonuclease [Sphingomonadaceae bacterium]MDW8414375.1 RNB domain-containing ribonuclease [Thermaurantiacus sp.]
MTLPDRAQLLDFLARTSGEVGKREIARAFGIRGEERVALKAMLRDLEAEGLIAPGPGRTFHAAGALPRVAVLRVVPAEGGRAIGVPDRWHGPGEPPRILIDTARRRPDPGERVLARLRQEGGQWRAAIIKRLRRGESQVLGIARLVDGRLRLVPVDRRMRTHFALSALDRPVRAGELILAEVRGTGPRATAYVTQHLGDPFAERSLSLIEIHARGIPHVFSEDAIAEAEAAAGAPLGTREDWRDLPFVTLDPEDARDHDDAVLARPLPHGGHEVRVAIADVAWFVRPGTALDRAAFDRGNSVYFPDRVVPMLPEALSADACSLKAGHDRAVLAAVLELAPDGRLRRFRFHRALVRIRANLVYEEAQALVDQGREPPELAALWAAWRALDRARARRAPLDLDLSEPRVLLDPEGRVADVRLRPRLDSHRVIEEMMIAANVAAARQLEARKAPVMYRVHEPPSREKLLALKEYLATFEIPFALGQVITPAVFNRILARAAGHEEERAIAEQVLRTQTQAYYAPLNAGHFGLALASYAHFTSPIRRYADVLVHRALISALGLGEGGLPPGAERRFAAIGDHISLTERRAMEAERDTLARYVAAHLHRHHEGQVVRARVTGVQPFGLFLSVEGLGGDGLLPVGALGPERFWFDEAARALESETGATRYRVGQLLEVQVAAADPATGAVLFALPGGAAVRRPAPSPPVRGRWRRERRA